MGSIIRRLEIPPLAAGLGMKLWFSVGDTLDWLETRRPTGIQRVTIELLHAALADSGYPAEFDLATCALAPADGWLASVPLRETSAFIDSKILGPSERDGSSSQMSRTSKPLRGDLTWPQARDHVLFTGAIWTPVYGTLFRRLRALDVDFSVFVYDLIPIERPDLVGDAHRAMFSDWLKTTVATARIVFVSSETTRRQLIEWAAAADADLRARIVPIVFGTTHLGHRSSSGAVGLDSSLDRLKAGAYVLSVGTIDKRKNQILLMKIWTRLVAELGRANVPRLVLAGRNDLAEEISNGGFASLLEQDVVAIVEDASDDDVGDLYRASLFTVFPSYIEGYGLPVAESLIAGKLCVTSDLPVIREFAGDLVWYFDPTVEKTAYDRIRQAIEMPELRATAEKRIREQFIPEPWARTFRTIKDAIRG